METTNVNEVGVSGTTEEFPESTVEINVKTLDSQTYTLRVNKYMPVPALKEQIANLTGILSGQQRLICRGKVLKDDQLLSAYHVEDGHTLHLVVRQPQPQSIASSVRLDDVPSHPGSNSGLNPAHTPLGHNVVLGAVNLADPGEAGTSDFNQVFSALFNSFGLTNIGMASERLDSRDANYGRSERTAGSGVSVASQSETSLGAGSTGISPHQSAFGPQSVHYLGQQHPTVIPDSLTTLSQFLSYVRHQFDIREHRLGNPVGQHSARAEAGRTQHSSGQNDVSPLNLPPEQRGLPTPACLAEILLSARQLLMEQVGECFYELAKDLEDQANVTDPLARARIQSRAGRYGNLFQNVGSLFLELGRTVMTLRMGQTPSEAVVNAGPAIFVSSAGATPLMVQAGPGFGGIPMGNQHPSGMPHGSGLLAGNINIRIHRGPSVPVPTANAGRQPAEQQPSGATDLPRASAENLVHQVFEGLLANASVPQESGPRVVPLRTVVAVPAGVAHPAPDSSGGAVGLLYPLYARFHQRTPGTLNDARVSQASLRTAQLQTPDSATRGPSGASTPGGQVTSDNNGEQAPEGEQSGAARDPATPTLSTFGEETQGRVDGDGLFFSGLVRQLMPFISENASEAAGSSSSGRDPNSSPRRSDPPEEPEPKRRKRE